MLQKRISAILALALVGSGSVQAGLLRDYLRRRAEAKSDARLLQQRADSTLPNGLRIGRFVRLDGRMYAVDGPEKWLELAKAENASDEGRLKTLIEGFRPVMFEPTARLLIVDYSSTILPALIHAESKRTQSTDRVVANVIVQLDKAGLKPENCTVIKVQAMEGPQKGLTGWIQANLVTAE